MFLDEVDKIGSVPGIHQLRDVGGEGVQQVSTQEIYKIKLFIDFGLIMNLPAVYFVTLSHKQQQISLNCNWFHVFSPLTYFG